MRRIALRTWDQRHHDPSWDDGVARPDLRHADPSQVTELLGKRLLRYDVRADPRDGDGLKTVVIHGKRVSELSPKQRWPHAELWGVTRCNVLYWRESLTDWDRWFDLHPVQSTTYHRGILAKRPEAWQWYTRQSADRPIYLLGPHADVVGSVAFPREAVQAFTRSSRFTVSVDWMIGLAMLEGFQRIVLNGIGTRFQADFQFAHQGILYWIGRAEGAGVEVVIEGPSCYHAPEKVYGFEAGAPAWHAQR
jgi:hypothetical protein